MYSRQDLLSWSEIKFQLNCKQNSPRVKLREIWWCSVGLNVGYEIFGKGEQYTRPVLVLRKFGDKTFLAFPLSTKIKENKNYFKFNFKGRAIAAVFEQVRVVDTSRLVSKMGKLPEDEFGIIKTAFLSGF